MPIAGRRVAKGPPKLVAKAFARVEARLLITRPGVQVPPDEFLREVVAEVCVMIALRAGRDVRKAVREISETGALIAAMRGRAAPVDGGVLADLGEAWFAADVPGELPPGRDGVPGPPLWHPEHRLNESEA
jgi:hypothetical protein